MGRISGGLAVGLLVVLVVGGCAGSGRAAAADGTESTRQADRAVAFVYAGGAVGLEALLPALAEAAGAVVVRDSAIDRAIADELGRRGLRITDADIAFERESFATEAGDASGRALAEVAAARGLGPVRLAALLRRNAGLRKLVGPVELTAGEVDAEAVLAFGPTVRARVIVTATERAAAAARRRAVADPAGPVAGMAAAAFADSIDPSSAIGGLFDRVSPSDPRLPASVAEQLRTLPLGEPGPVVAFDGGVAVVLVESRSEGRTPDAAERARLRESLVRRREAEAMGSLARQLLREADVTVVDPGLRWAFESGRGGG